MKMPKLKLDIVFALLCIAFFCFTLVSSLSWDLPSLLFVWFAALPGLICMGVFFARQMKQMRRGDNEVPLQTGQPPDRDAAAWGWSREEVMFFGRLIAFLAAIWLLGFEIGALLFAFLYLRFKARESWLLSIVTTAILAGLISGLLGKLLQVSWPEGALGVWLGL